MPVQDFFKHKIFSRKFSMNKIYLLSFLLFILVVGIFVAVVTFGTIQQNKTQAKAAAPTSPKYDPIVLGQQFLAGMPKSLVIKVSYDPKTQIADVIGSDTTYGEISLPYTVSPAGGGSVHPFKFKLKDKNQKVLREAWINYNNDEYVPDKTTGKITLVVVVPDEPDLQLEFADRGGKKLIDKPFSDMPAINQSWKKGK